MIQQRNKYITKNIYFIQEKSVDINKTVNCKIFCEVLLIDGVAANVDLWQLGVEMTTTRLMLN